MTLTTLYLGSSTVLGILQILDAWALWRAQGKMTPLLGAFSVVELVWAVISFFVCNEIDAPQWLPLAFTVYFSSFLLIGITVRKQIMEEGVPKQVIVAGGIFGACFAAVSCVYFIKQ